MADADFKTYDAPALAARPFRVVQVGAGLVGCHFASRFREFTTGIDFQIYEKNATVGGTWVNNIYPGVACDIPSMAYTFPEHPYHAWSHFQAPGADCAAYCEFLAKKTHLYDYARFNVKIVSVTWQDDKGIWAIKAVDTKTGEQIDDHANVVINSTGLLAQPKYADVKGLEKFKGPVLHTAEWRSEDLKGKTIALIGGGSSAMQTLPALREQGKHVDQYVKSTTWVTPMFGAEERDRFFGFKDGLMSGYASQDVNRVNPPYSKATQEELHNNPAKLRAHRKGLLNEINGLFHKDLSRKGSQIGQEFKALVTQLTNDRLVNHPELKRFFLPDWTPGCRRPTPSPGFMEAVLSPNVKLIPHKVVEVTKDGLIDDAGTERKYDVLAFATGFWTDFSPPFDVIGLDGHNLRDPSFRADPKSYMVCTFPNMPNYFCPNGPFLHSLNGEFLAGLAKLGDYSMKCIIKLQTMRYKSMVPKAEAVNDFTAYADEWLKGSIHTESCSAWYKQNSTDGKLRSIWPGTVLGMMEILQDPCFEDFNFTRLDGEEKGPARYNWLGNGHGRREMESGDCSYYIPLVQDLDKPVAAYGSPEARRFVP